MNNIKIVEKFLSQEVYGKPVKLKFNRGARSIEPDFGCIKAVNPDKDDMTHIFSDLGSSKSDFLNAHKIYVTHNNNHYNISNEELKPKQYCDGFIEFMVKDTGSTYTITVFADVKPLEERLKQALPMAGIYYDSISRYLIRWDGKSGRVYSEANKKGHGYQTKLGFTFNSEGKLRWDAYWGKHLDRHTFEERVITANLKKIY